jgi:uncharacterized protein (TIGR03066 family)
MRMLLAGFAVAIAATAVVADPIPKKKEPTPEEKLLGKWNLVKQRGTEVNDVWIEFAKDGKLNLHFGAGMGNVTYKGKYKADKETIDYEIDMAGETHGEKLKIKSLTDDKLVTEDPDGVVEEFERAKEKKKDDK